MRSRTTSALNILGLTLGLSAALVIGLIIKYEYSFDRHYENVDRIYSAVTKTTTLHGDNTHHGIPEGLYEIARREVSGVEKFTEIRTDLLHDAKVTLNSEETKSSVTYQAQDNVSFATADFFEIFERKFLAGSGLELDSEPFKVVLTEERAKLYFPDKRTNEIPGLTITYNDSLSAQVIGIIADNKQPSEINPKELVSLPTIKSASLEHSSRMKSWNELTGATQLFVRVSSGHEPLTIQKQLSEIVNREREKQLGDLAISIELEPISELHLAGIDNTRIKILFTIGIILIGLGCINYVNLSTANAVKKAKEIGIRKSMGSSRKSLAAQLLIETFLLCSFSCLLAVTLTPLLFVFFAEYIPAGLTIGGWSQVQLLIFAPVLVIVVTMLAGFYPAFLLSGYKPIQMLKSHGLNGFQSSGRISLRKGLIVSQFVVANLAVMLTVVIMRQIDYSVNLDTGVRISNIVTVQVPLQGSESSNKIQLLQSEIKSIPGVLQTSLGDMPVLGGSQQSIRKTEIGNKQIELIVEDRNIDTSYLSLFSIPLIAGRNLRVSDSTEGVLVNEKLVEQIGLKTSYAAIGQVLEDDDHKVRIIGVIRNYHYTSTRSAIKPLVLRSVPRLFQNINILVDNVTETPAHAKTLSLINKAFEKFYLSETFKPRSFDEEIAELYNYDFQIAKLLKWSAGLAIFISSLGLIGLVTFVSNQKRKEIGIRKVLGASVTQIVMLLSKDFIKLVLLACLVAVPVAWILSQRWIEDFSYRTPINIWLFLLCSGFLLVIAFLIISFKTLKTASANPVKSIKTE